ncbi:MAG: hypothetical protein ABSD70_08290 [Terracidiphilus sp.]
MTSPSMQATYADISDADLSANSDTGALIVNADDWGRDVATTDSILHCVKRATVSSASGMVFMQDSCISTSPCSFRNRAAREI